MIRAMSTVPPSPSASRLPLPLLLPLVLLALVPALSAQPESAAPVRLAAVEAATLGADLRLTGTVTAERSARLSPRVDGLVARVLVDAGDRVEAGQPLLELDADLAGLALRRARAGTAQARAQADESRRLAEEAQRLAADRHIAQTEVATRQAAVALADAALGAAAAAEREQAELVARHRLTAPFAGVVAERMTEAGEWVARGTPVLALVATDKLRLDVQAPQERYADVVEGAAVEVRPDAQPERVLAGRVQAKVPVGDGSSRGFLVRILVDDAEDRLLPGSSASVRIELPAAAGSSVLVPTDALLRYPDGGNGVFVAVDEDGTLRAHQRRIAIGRELDGRVEVLDGLAAGEQVVVRGNEGLRDGQAVSAAD
jgi:RND family efflux transporter MFP subunit